MVPPSELKMELKPEMDVSSGEKSDTIREDIQEKTVHCASNYEDNSFDMEESNSNQEKVTCEEGDLQIDGVGFTYFGDRGQDGTADCSDATEHSTSFGDTVSGTDDILGLSDNEIESSIHSDGPFGGLDGFSRMRKKRLTDHWRKFIVPIMWRCKWIELQIREFQSQAKKYDRELDGYHQRKQCELEKLNLEGSNTRSVCLSSQSGIRKVVKRRKRKRVEATTDVAAYMSNHNLFSYYDHRKSGAEGCLLNENIRVVDQKIKNIKDEIDNSDEAISLDLSSRDLYLEEVLWKIEVTKSEAKALKSRIDKVLSDFPGKFSSVNRLSWLQPGDLLTSPSSNAGSDEKVDIKPIIPVCTPSKHTPADDTGDLLIPETAGSSHGEMSRFPTKMIKAMEEEASAGSSLKRAKDKTPKNQAAKDEFQRFERAKNQLTKRPQASAEMPNKSLQLSRSKIPKRKRKRGKRRPGFGGLRRRTGV